MPRWSCKRCFDLSIPCTRKPNFSKCDACRSASVACENSTIYHSRRPSVREGIDISLLKQHYTSSADLLSDVLRQKPKSRSKVKHLPNTQSSSGSVSKLRKTKSSSQSQITNILSFLRSVLIQSPPSLSSISTTLSTSARVSSFADHLLSLPDLQRLRLSPLDNIIGPPPQSWSEFQSILSSAANADDASFTELLTMYYLTWAAGNSPHSELLGRHYLPFIPIHDESGDWREQGKARGNAILTLVKHVFTIALSKDSPLWKPSEKILAMLIKLIYTFGEEEVEGSKEALKVAISQFEVLHTGADEVTRERLKSCYLESIIQADHIIHYAHGGLPELSDSHLKKYYPISKSIPDYRVFTNPTFFLQLDVQPPEKPQELGQFFDTYWAALESITSLSTVFAVLVPDVFIVDTLVRTLNLEQALKAFQGMREIVLGFRVWRERVFKRLPEREETGPTGVYYFYLSRPRSQMTMDALCDITSGEGMEEEERKIVEPPNLSQTVIGMMAKHTYMLLTFAVWMKEQFFPTSKPSLSFSSWPPLNPSRTGDWSKIANGNTQMEKMVDEAVEMARRDGGVMFKDQLFHVKKTLEIKKSFASSNLVHPFFAQDTILTFRFCPGQFVDTVQWLKEKDELDFLIEKMKYMSFRSRWTAMYVDTYEERLKEEIEQGRFSPSSSPSLKDFEKTLNAEWMTEDCSEPSLKDFSRTLGLEV